MFAPIEVKAKRQLYCLIFFINLLEIGPPSDLARVARGSGLGRNRGMATLPPLQHLLYITEPEEPWDSLPTLLACQKWLGSCSIANQVDHNMIFQDMKLVHRYGTGRCIVRSYFFWGWVVHRAKSKGTCAVKIWNQYL